MADKDEWSRRQEFVFVVIDIVLSTCGCFISVWNYLVNTQASGDSLMTNYCTLTIFFFVNAVVMCVDAIILRSQWMAEHLLASRDVESEHSTSSTVSGASVSKPAPDASDEQFKLKPILSTHRKIQTNRIRFNPESNIILFDPSGNRSEKK